MVKAAEGMWPMATIDSALVIQMQQLGAAAWKMQLYQENEPSFKDAVVLFDQGCTATFVSSQGLLFTNYHCVINRLQQLSTPENNILHKGFWASTFEEELPVKGLSVRLLLRSVNVTQEAQKLLETHSHRSMAMHLERVYNQPDKNIVSQLESYSDGQYVVSVYQQFTDLRLVGVPPESLGNFGGATDNFQWPRHTADFAVFRVYANAHNLPASYAATNVAYQPAHYFPISLEGVQEHDFVMSIGFPGNTQRDIHSFKLQEELEVKHATTLLTKGKYAEVVNEAMQQCSLVTLKYTHKHFLAANSAKFSSGVIAGMASTSALTHKQQFEREMEHWIQSDERRSKKYGHVLSSLSALYSQRQLVRYAHALLSGALFGDASLFGIRTRNIVEILQKNDTAELSRAVESLERWHNGFMPTYDVTTDKLIVKAMVQLVRKHLPTHFLPAFFSVIDQQFQGDTDKYVDFMFSNTLYFSPKKWQGFLREPSLRVLDDPLFQFGVSIYDTLIALRREGAQHSEELRAAEQLFQEARLAMQPQSTSPNANGSMRLTFGQVKSFSPRDAVLYESKTTLDGLIAKACEHHADFTVSNRLRYLHAQANYGPYAVRNELYTCFLSTTDITSGNSGSPVLNAKGQLTGLAFDGNFESLAGIYWYDKSRNRAINVDVRFILFVIDRYAQSTHILSELTLLDN